MTAQPQNPMTVHEYLVFEAQSPDKHEYYGGRIVLLAGGNQAHAIICSNINALLSVQLLDHPCIVYTSDMKVKAEHPDTYMYPDVSVVCGESRFEDTHRRVLLNPVVIVEVLSDSTERFDRGKKFQYYRRIESVQEYILVAQDAQHIDHYQRQPGNLWLLSFVDSADGHLHLPAINCTLALDRIYNKVPFDTERDSPEDVE